MKRKLERKHIAWILNLLLAILFLASAYGKILKAPSAVSKLGSQNLEPWVSAIGWGEVVSIILFIIPFTKKLGTFLMSAFLGGAIMFHMSNTNPEDRNFLFPALLLIIIWIVAWMRGVSPFSK